MKKFMLICLSVIMLSGCVAPMTTAEVNSATYAELPTNYQEQLKVIISSSLKDPDSAKFKFYPPRKGYTAATRHFGYVVPVDVNAKNSYGGYAGYQMFYFVYYGNEFKDVTTGVKLEAVKWSDEVK